MNANHVTNVPSTKIICFLERLIESLLILILVGAPLAFGSVHAIIYRPIQMISLLILFSYSVHGFLIRIYLQPTGKIEAAKGDSSPFFRRHSYVILLLIWLAFVAVETIPLPPEFLGTLSGETHRLYGSILGFYPAVWRPISLSPFDTRHALLQVITAGILFYIVGIYKSFRIESEFPTAKGLWRSLVKGPTDDSLFNGLLFASSFVVAFEVVYGLWEYLTGRQHIYFFTRLIPADGAAGTFVNRDHFASYILLFFPIFFSWLTVSVSAPKHGDKRVRSFWGRAVLFFLGLLLIGMSVALVVSHSRMAIVSALAAVFLICLSFFSWGLPRRGIVFLLVAMASSVLFLFYLDPGFSSFKTRVLFLLEGHETNRFRVWQDSFRMIRDFPWTGTGLGTFQFIFPKYSSVPIARQYIHAHSEWLELLVETGIPGFVLILSGLVGFIVSSVKQLRSLDLTNRPLAVGILISLIAFIIHSMAEFNFHIPANAYSFAILAGMGVRLFEMKKVVA